MQQTHNVWFWPENGYRQEWECFDKQQSETIRSNLTKTKSRMKTKNKNKNGIIWFAAFSNCLMFGRSDRDIDVVRVNLIFY